MATRVVAILSRSLIALVVAPLACSESEHPSTGSVRTMDSGAGAGTAGSRSTGGVGGMLDASRTGGASGMATANTGGVGGGGMRASGGAGAIGGPQADGGLSSPDADSGCVPGGPCKLSAGPCHVGHVICDAVGIGWCQDDGLVADGTYCGVHGTCVAGSCVEITPCNVTYDCAAGQTCWTKDGARFDCMTSGSGRAGDSCNPSVFSAITCGDGLACLGNATIPGKCVAWCNSAPCTAGKTCTSVPTAKGVTLQFCL